MTFEWNRSETLALAANSCSYCHGLGLKAGRRGKDKPCKCVLRAIFRLCYERFRDCVQKEKFTSAATLDNGGGGARRNLWSRKNEEYVADFYLMAKRTLTGQQWRVFNAHFLQGAGWRLCCKQLGMDRGNFFHEIYRIQEALGRAFRETEPYALFPIDEYFNGATADPARLRLRPPHRNPRPPLRPPMLDAA